MERCRKDEHGNPVMVVRPTNLKLATKVAMIARVTGIFPSFDEMQDKCGPYTFMGYLSLKGEIIFDKGKGFVKVGKCKLGDSFITENKKDKETETKNENT